MTSQETKHRHADQLVRMKLVEKDGVVEADIGETTLLAIGMTRQDIGECLFARMAALVSERMQQLNADQVLKSRIDACAERAVRACESHITNHVEEYAKTILKKKLEETIAAMDMTIGIHPKKESAE